MLRTRKSRDAPADALPGVGAANPAAGKKGAGAGQKLTGPRCSRNVPERVTYTASALPVGRMKAPMIQSSGRKIPKKNILPWPFLMVMSPSVTPRSGTRARRIRSPTT